MIRTCTLALALALLPAAGLNAAHHEGDALTKVLKADYRADDKARDVYRHPAETLAFFGIEPGMAVGEYGPGGGWYTRVLAPFIPDTFPGRVAEWTGLGADSINAIEIDEAPDWQGKLDAVLTFRGFHGLARQDLADETIAHFYGLLKPGGIVGVVQHRASEDAPYDYTRGHNGYLKQSEVIAMFESEGFELVKSSEINANENDTADHDGGVWSLPPTLRHGDKDKARYTAIGESDRMTLVFRKPA